MALPYPSMSFVPLDVLTADELNQMVANDQYLATEVGTLTTDMTAVESVLESVEYSNPGEYQNAAVTLSGADGYQALTSISVNMDYAGTMVVFANYLITNFYSTSAFRVRLDGTMVGPRLNTLITSGAGMRSGIVSFPITAGSHTVELVWAPDSTSSTVTIARERGMRLFTIPTLTA